MAVAEAVKHSVQRTVSVVGVLSAVAVVGFVGWSGYVALIKPHTNPTRTTDQHAEQINNPTYTAQPHFGGCANMRIYEYYRKKDEN